MANSIQQRLFESFEKGRINVDVFCDSCESLEFVEKGKKAAVIGEKRTFGGREYIKTAQGWKFHGKGTGAKAQEHTNPISNENKKSAIEKDSPIGKLFDIRPRNAKSWSQADDLMRDLTRKVRLFYNEYRNKSNPPEESLNFAYFKTPSEWNTKAQDQIQKCYKKLPQQDRQRLQDIVAETFKQDIKEFDSRNSSKNKENLLNQSDSERKQNFRKFTSELEKLSKKYGIIIHSTGGVFFHDGTEEVNYDSDHTSGDLTSI